MAKSDDLFGGAQRKPASAAPAAKAPKAPAEYDAASIEVLEGLEPVRRRPGMYIGGKDEAAMHHLFAEVLDNSMDEAVAGHASFIEVSLEPDGWLTVIDNGRGIPVGPHPKFPKKSALEVVMTMLHAGGKFDSGAYQTSGGLHGVGVSVVNALSERLEVEVAQNQQLYRQIFSRGLPQGKLEELGRIANRRGTKIRFKPDAEIFGAATHWRPARLFRMARSKAYLFGGVEIRWRCAPALIEPGSDVPAEAVLRFPGGLRDYLARETEGKDLVADQPFVGKVQREGGHGSLEWAIAWFTHEDGFSHSYCNTIPTPDGGTHEAGFRLALLRGLKDHAERIGQAKRAALLTADDLMGQSAAMISVFIREPEFQGQNKTRLMNVEASRVVENTVRDAFDHWLAGAPSQATKLLDFAVERAEERLRRRAEKEQARKSPTRKLRLPGKLADCTNTSAQGSELFIVEGDSAGGSAKAARDRASQAVLPLRGKILNVASAGKEKFAANQQLADLAQALGCGSGSHYRDEDLRYDKIIVMTDADVDGAHIASLLITFFFRQMPKLIDGGHLYLAVPPLYKLTQGAKTVYARDDRHRDELVKKVLTGKGKIETSRFKGLGEMMPAQLKETTMDAKKRTLLKVVIAGEEREETADCVERLMGTKPEARFAFIQERAPFATELDV
ncbi:MULTISPECIES: DNA topoisomerase IV subunit B [Methylosinus]|uniref:DNA topoisomerase 4 subunit B n=1 Tax=Methylosinus trichosporium (strain ATCC 35070 / NCIMB 11131 / UNIQEM 75 / OB3b) TaxID=595536 RepID=A0A2D2CZB8_METT3|nr:MULTISPECIES: DNA topoisomerase IV subunit B [Methylosinus]ATQ68093.1 DNA topoisomerase IV subunit B [Methylosinus trichosporium OB3b]OBS54348.1 DNA topoisomerase IV subunit B [Methylosinus sp. 3S-1]